MREHYLKKENVLGIDVCDIPPEKAVALSLEGIHSHELNTVFFLSARGSNYCQKTPWALDLVNSLELVVPGDRHTEMAVQHQSLPDDNGFGEFAQEFMDRFFTRMHREYRELFITSAVKERLDGVVDYLHKMYPNISVFAMVYDAKETGAADQLVNEINGHTPDALFLLLKPGEQLHLLRDYESMMNTGLCICIESLKQLIIEETRPIPGWIRFLHLESVYHWFNKEERIESQIEGNLFKKRITEDAMTDTEQYEQNKL